MILAISLLILSAVLIYLSSEYFVNSIEWLGHHLNISQHATGSILAAIGTALPETTVTFIALICANSPAEQNIGIGSALGGPMILSTLAFSIVGLSLLLKSTNEPVLSLSRNLRLSYNQLWFILVFFTQLALSFVQFPYKYLFGLGFFLIYMFYLRLEMKGSDEPEQLDFKEPLKFDPTAKIPNSKRIYLQTTLSIIVMFVSSNIFVEQLQILAPMLGLSPQLIGLLLSPIATELPEILNAVIWIRQGKKNLALANISGSMMVQTTVPTGFGILLTTWDLDRYSLLSSILTLMAGVSLFWLLRTNKITPKNLMLLGGYYLIFIALSFCN